MSQWPSGIFCFLTLWALIWWLLELAAEKMEAAIASPDDAADEDDEEGGYMDDPLWLEIVDAAEEFLKRGDSLARHRLERALEAVEC